MMKTKAMEELFAEWDKKRDVMLKTLTDSGTFSRLEQKGEMLKKKKKKTVTIRAVVTYNIGIGQVTSSEQFVNATYKEVLKYVNNQRKNAASVSFDNDGCALSKDQSEFINYYIKHGRK